ncbi:chorismate mutase [Spirochaetota bacterium]
MAVRGVRGAITAESNTKEEIVSKTRELLDNLVKRNNIDIDDISAVIFSATDDIDAEFPAVAARKLGWIYTPLFCAREIPVQGSLSGVVRVLMLVNSDKKQSEIVQVYMHGAEKLRPDLNHENHDKYYSS